MTKPFHILLLVVFCGCGPSIEKLGMVKIEGIEGIHFVIYQERDFDSATALYYKIEDENGKEIQKMFFLGGTHDYYENTNDFLAGSYDSIIFLSYYVIENVDIIYDLKNKHPLDRVSTPYDVLMKERDSLLAVLKTYNPKIHL